MMTERFWTRPAEILIVDDDDGDIELAREAFKEVRTRTNIHIVNDGIDALVFLRRRGIHKNAPRPDLVLLDLNMPRMGGYELLTKIKRRNALKDIPVVVLTTSELDEDFDRCYAAGANACLTKPADLDEFFTMIASLEDFWLRRARLPEGAGPLPDGGSAESRATPPS